MKTGELSRARTALDRGELASALFLLQQAERVAVAQRKLDELLEVRELVTSLAARSSGRTKAASDHLARKVAQGVRDFPPEALVSVGIEPEPDPLGPLLAGWKLRPPAAVPALTRTRELSRARAALDDADYSGALFFLREAQRVAVAQRKPDELLEVYELVQVLAERSDERVRAASEVLLRRVEAGLRTFAPGANV